MRKAHSRAALLVVVCLLSTACIHKTGGPVTPWERVNTDSALFAQINQTVEQGTEAVVTSGALTAAQAMPVIAFTSQVAVIHKQLESILALGPNISAQNVASIQMLLLQVQSAGTALINSGAIGIKNPKTQQSISADVQAIVNLASTILGEIVQLQANPALPANPPPPPMISGGL